MVRPMGAGGAANPLFSSMGQFGPHLCSISLSTLDYSTCRSPGILYAAPIAHQLNAATQRCNSTLPLVSYCLGMVIG
jgi:hypothetical protein